MKISFLKLFWERTLPVVIFAPFYGKFSKNWAFSNDLKGVVMENFPGASLPDPIFPSFALAECTLFSMNLVSDNPI